METAAILVISGAAALGWFGYGYWSELANAPLSQNGFTATMHGQTLLIDGQIDGMPVTFEYLPIIPGSPNRLVLVRGRDEGPQVRFGSMGAEAVLLAIGPRGIAAAAVVPARLEGILWQYPQLHSLPYNCVPMG